MGYKLHKVTAYERGKTGARFEAQKSGYRLENAHPSLPSVRRAYFSAKRRMGPVRSRCVGFAGSEISLCAFLRDLPGEGIFIYGLQARVSAFHPVWSRRLTRLSVQLHLRAQP